MTSPALYGTLPIFQSSPAFHTPNIPLPNGIQGPSTNFIYTPSNPVPNSIQGPTANLIYPPSNPSPNWFYVPNTTATLGLNFPSPYGFYGQNPPPPSTFYKDGFYEDDYYEEEDFSDDDFCEDTFPSPRLFDRELNSPSCLFDRGILTSYANLFNIFENCIYREMTLSKLEATDITKGIDLIHKNYSKEVLNTNANSLDFSHVNLRWAYVFLFCTSHTQMVVKSFEYLYQARPTFFRNFLDQCVSTMGQLNYCSIGSGPGSDVIGTLLYLKQYPDLEKYPVKVHLLDGYPGWSDAFQSIMNEFNQQKLFPGNNSVKFTFQDLLRRLSTVTMTVLKQTRLITMVKFVSAIYAEPQKAEDLLRTIFDSVAVGTVIVLIDNSGGGYFDRSSKIAEMSGFKMVVKPLKHVWFCLDKNCEPSIFSKNQRFNRKAQNRLKVSVAFLQKQQDCSARGRKRVRYQLEPLSECPVGTCHVNNIPNDERDSGIGVESGYSPFSTPSCNSRIVKSTDDVTGDYYYTATPKEDGSLRENETPRRAPLVPRRKFSRQLHLTSTSQTLAGETVLSTPVIPPNAKKICNNSSQISNNENACSSSNAQISLYGNHTVPGYHFGGFSHVPPQNFNFTQQPFPSQNVFRFGWY